MDNKDLSYTDIIKGLISGELKSPQIYGESFYINLRITGTGITERYIFDDNNEIVLDNNNNPKTYQINRSEEEFLSDKFLDACNSIPVLIEHPNNKNQLLDGDNYKKHNVGTIIKAFIKPELKEVWGVARIYDPKVLLLITDKLKSTSPAITSKNIEDKNGLINEIFEYIDHLALVVDGYWDDYSDKAIQIDKKNKIKGANIMNEEKRKLIDEVADMMRNADASDELIKDVIAKIEAIASDDTADNNDIPDDPANIDEGNKEPEPILDNTKCDSNNDIMALLNTILEIVKANKDTTPIAEPKSDDNNDDLSKDKLTDDIIDIADEEEKATLVDKAYNMHLSYKEDGLQCPRVRSQDTKESYITRFLMINKDKIAEKYRGFVDKLINNKLDKSEYALAVDAMNSIKSKFENDAYNKKKELTNKFVVELSGNSRIYHNAI